MSTKDISRLLFQPAKHYASARLQQGRSLLDSDYNEGAALDAEEWRRAVLDAVGPRGTPDEGFSIGQPGQPPSETQDVFAQPLPLEIGVSIDAIDVTLDITVSAIPVSVRKGTFYLGGMRFELDRPEPIMFQRDFLQMTGAELELGSFDNPTLYYLEAWEQPVSGIEDEELIDRALGGPDTMARIRRFRRVRLLELDPDTTSCQDGFNQLITSLEQDGLASFNCNTSELESAGRLQLVFQAGSDGGPCTPDPPAQYLGVENQTLRIMLTDPNNFVWAFDNAAPLYRVNLPGLTTFVDNGSSGSTMFTVQLLTPPRDVDHQPLQNRVVEFLPFAALIDGTTLQPDNPHFRKAAAEMGVFTRVTGNWNPNGTFQVDVSGGVLAQLQALVTEWSEAHPFFEQLDPSASSKTARPMYARFWHVAPADTAVTVPVNTSPTGPPLADTGIIPVFQVAGRAGDFWVAALRPDTPQRIVPFDLLTNPNGVAPHGPRHFFAPLAVLTFETLIGDNPDTGVGFEINSVSTYEDCRSRMRRLVDAGCTTFTVGDGLHTVGDFTSIQEAIDALPNAGGRVSILPGLYQQTFAILGRMNVIVEGCGDATIVETPPATTTDQLVEIDSAQNVTIANLRLHAVEQPGILANNSSELALVGLAALAFVTSGSGVAPGAATSNTALIELHECSHATLQGLLLEPARRPAVLIQGTSSAQDVTLSDISALGSNDATLAPTPAVAALIIIQGMQSVTVRRASLQTFGQVAVALEPPASNTSPVNSDITLSELTIVAGERADLVGQPAVDVDGGTRVILEDSEITQAASYTDHAAVVLLGSGVIVRGNSVVTQSEGIPGPGWGGIQVRGTSSQIEIYDNEVSGGLGHGITLGSVLWGTDQHREAAGAGQVTAPDGDGFRFVTGNLAGSVVDGSALSGDEGVITDLTIADNRISGFATNGISALTVLGLASSGQTQLMEIQTARIERNHIEGNLFNPFPSVAERSDVLPFPASAPVGGATTLDLRVLPFGGIVLATVTSSLIIAANTIEDNGLSSILAINGIFILNGDGIDIVQNKIARNGSTAIADVPGNGNAVDNTPQAGVRAGIAIMLAGNEATDTNAIDELLTIPSTPPTTSNSGNLALRVYQNSVQQPEGRALHAVATGAVVIDGNFLSSQGLHGSDSAEDAFAIGDAVFVQNLGAPWEVVDAGDLPGATPSNPFPGFVTPIAAQRILVLNSPNSPRRFVGAGGGVLFTNNQVIYDWDVKRPPVSFDSDNEPPLSFFAVTILTLDHLCCVANNFALRLGSVPAGTPPPTTSDPSVFTEPLLSNVFLGGSTVQVARNRFSENVLATTLSLISAGELMNITDGNQGTHPTLAYQLSMGVGDEDPSYFRSNNNIALFTKVGVDFANEVRFDLRGQIKSFFTLLQ